MCWLKSHNVFGKTLPTDPFILTTEDSRNIVLCIPGSGWRPAPLFTAEWAAVIFAKMPSRVFATPERPGPTTTILLLLHGKHLAERWPKGFAYRGEFPHKPANLAA
ncbi:hypothetical protein KCP70_24325 [Salmonella enterica subsp. enterica]|nr:hypothetical protein KCP70_24325 [Salmonella enterica subsp. enterica]